MFKKIYLEITNSCNLNCTFCKGTKRKKQFMDFNDFKIILEKLDGFTNYLYFHIMGEPLLHPLINDFINEASKKYFVNITSNGYLISKIKNNSNIRQINISLHSFNDRYGISLDNYLSDIFNTTDLLLKNGTIIKYRLWTKNENASLIINRLENKYGLKINSSNVKLASNVYFEEEEEFIWPSLENDFISNVGSCRGTRDHLGILVDGTVVPCCLDSDGIINLGNIYKSNLNDIIGNTLFKEIKEGFCNNKKIHELCQRCNFYSLRNNR